MMTMKEFYERAARRVDARDNNPAGSYVDVECKLRRLCGEFSAVYLLTDLNNPEMHRAIKGRSPEECLLLWDMVNYGETKDLSAILPDSPEHQVRPTHLGNGEVQ